MISGISRDTKMADGSCRWSFRAIRWSWVFKYQDYVNIFLTVGFAVGYLVADRVQDPTYRPFLEYDATISLPHKGDSSIPYWLAIVLPLLLMFLSFIMGELILARRWHGAVTGAVASLLFFTLDGICAFVLTGFATQVTKVGVGRLRPDFLARCQPQKQAEVTVQWGESAQANPACTPGAVSEAELKDGHYSFPSGHTSTVFVFAVYGAAYCLWAFYSRVKQQPPRKASGTGTPTSTSSSQGWVGAGSPSLEGSDNAKRHTVAGRWGRDLLGLLGFVWILLQMGFAWGVGASRIIDNKHHACDVVGGAVLGSAIALLYFLRAVPRHRRLDELDAGDAGAEPTPLLGRPGEGTNQHLSSTEV